MAALESEVQALKQERHSLPARKPNPNWVKEVAGSMKDFPEWDEVMQICREMREAELAEFDRQSQGDAFATPANHNGQLLVRSDKYLYCLGTK